VHLFGYIVCKKVYIFCAGCKFGYALYGKRPFLRTVLFRETTSSIRHQQSVVVVASAAAAADFILIIELLLLLPIVL